MKSALKKAVEWFISLIAQSKKAKNDFKDTSLVGKLIFMEYDPQLKKTLPYYDIYPLIFVISMKPDYLLGINLHYLDQRYRKTLFNSLIRFGIKIGDIRYTEDNEYDKNLSEERKKLQKFKNSSIKFRYSDLDGFIKEPLVRVCIKKYKIRKIKNWMLIPADDWQQMVFLPLQKFEKQSATYVWKESLDIVRGIE